ncbi:transposase [Bacteroidia bacterium]|nr:transposase [Bacteroidia bacterium]
MKLLNYDIMARRQTFDVNEEYLKEVMAGSALPPGKVEPQAEPEKENPSQGAVEPAVAAAAEGVREDGDTEATATAKSSRKRKEPQDYEGVFLRRRPAVERRQTYVSRYVYEKMSSFLPVIANGFTVTAYIDNILMHHLEQHSDEINELYLRKSKKPF